MSEFITILETRDPLELEAAESYLRAHGIEARAIGTRNGALIGASQHIFGLRIEVAKADEAAAREALAALASGVEGVAADDLPDELASADDPAEPTRKTWVRAAPSAFILPGGAHLYAGRGWSALVIACFEVASFVWLMSGRWQPFVLGVFMLAGGISFDLIGGVRALRRARPRVAVQLGAPLPFFAAIVALGVFSAPHIIEPEAQESAIGPLLYEPDLFPLPAHDDVVLHDDGTLQLALNTGAFDAPGYQSWWQGAEFDWRHAGATLTLTEVTLHSDSGDKDIGTLQGVAALGETRYFPIARDGLVNRSFKSYDAGQTYCVDGFVSWSDLDPVDLGKVVHVRLVDRLTLDLVVVTRPSCGPPPYDLTGATRYLR